MVNQSQTLKNLDRDNEKLGVEISMSVYEYLPCMNTGERDNGMNYGDGMDRKGQFVIG